jgi:hypothetical protein
MAPRPGFGLGGACSQPRKMKTYSFLLALMIFALVPARAGQNELPPAPPPTSEDTNALETLRSYLHLQEQIHSTQLAIEENRKELNQAAARNAEIVAARLQNLEQTLVTTRGRELEAMQSSQRLLLTVVGAIACLGFVAMVLMAWSHWRTMNRFAEIAVELPASRRLGPTNPRAALGHPETAVIAVGPAEETNSRLLGAIDRLEKRIFELEQTAQAPLPAPTAPLNEGGEGGAAGLSEKESHLGQITVLLGKGQSLLNVDKTEEALACFDQVLALDQHHAEALVKKGTALERLRKNNEAIACYDQAIAADSSMTIAYLYKGGLFNRLERFTEAIECYEKALRTQEKGAQA